MSFKGRLQRLDEKLERLKAARRGGVEWPSDPMEFCIQKLGFEPTSYQEKLLNDQSQFIVARWSRQSGKTHCVAVLLLWLCLRNPGFNALVLAPSIRQSKIIIRKITGFLTKLPKYAAMRPYRTKIEFYNGSRIQAFPNSPETIRGEPGVNFLYCLPAQSLVLRPTGTSISICKLKPGDSIVSFNTFTRVLESKRVLRVISSSLEGRSLVRINHEYGVLECTAEHRVFTVNSGYVPAGSLRAGDRLLSHREIQAPAFENFQSYSRTTCPRRPSGRLRVMAAKHDNKRPPHRESLLQASRVRSVQVLDSAELRALPSAPDQEWGMGNLEHRFPYTEPSEAHRNLRTRVPVRKEDDYYRLARENYFPVLPCDLVHGRWFDQQVEHLHLYAFIPRNGMSTSSTMARFKMGHCSANGGRQAWDWLLLSSECIRAGQALRADSSLHNTKHGIQGQNSEKTKNWTGSVQARSKVSSQLHNLREAIRNGQTEPDYLHAVLRPRKETTNASSVSDHVQSAEKISPNCCQDAEDHSAKKLHMLRSSVYSTKQPSKDVQCNVLRGLGSKESREVRSKKTIPSVYDLEVEDNHNFFSDGILVSNCDEFSYVRDDRELYQAAVFTLATTNGRFLATSTPGSRDSLFYEMCTDDENYGNVSRHHVSYQDALEPNGPLKAEILEKLKQQLAMDPWRWRREMEAEFADDEDAWLSFELIKQCVDEKLEYISESDLVTK